MVIKKVACCLDDFRSHSQYGRLSGRAHPKMTVFHKEIDTMLFQRDGVGIRLRHSLHNLYIRDVELVTAGCTLIGADLPLDDHAGFLGEALHRVEDFRCNRVLSHDTLDDTSTIAKNRKQQFPAFAQVVKPAANSDGLAGV